MAHKCPMCKKDVTTNSIACSVCDLWIHKACTGMSNDLFKLLVEMKDQGQCEPCASARKIIDQRLTNLEKTVSKIQETVAANVEGIANNSEKVDQAVIQIGKIQESVNKLKSSGNEDAAKAMIAEQMEQNLKKLNVIIHNLKEPATDLNGYQKKQADHELVSKVLSEINCSVKPEEDIKFSTRIGKVTSGSITPRPLLIGFRNMEKKNEVLDKMRTCTNKPENFISVVPDLTKLQRKVEDELKVEAEKRNKDMSEEDFLLWEWKVVGMKGEKRLAKIRKIQETEHSQSQGLGQTRDPRQGRGRGHKMTARPTSNKRKTRSGENREEVQEEENPTKKKAENPPNPEQ